MMSFTEGKSVVSSGTTTVTVVQYGNPGNPPSLRIALEMNITRDWMDPNPEITSRFL